MRDGTLRYAEAYCRIPISAVYRASVRGEGDLVWRESAGHVIGSARVVSLSSNQMRVAFTLSASGAVEAFAGEMPVEIVWKAAGLHRREAYAICTACTRAVKQLIAKRHAWLCRRCHGLVNRSSLIRFNARLTEAVAQLDAKVARGRPKGMHNATYEALLIKREEARNRLAGSSLRADSRFDHVVTHHISKPFRQPKYKTISIRKPKSTPLFEERLRDILNSYFVAAAKPIVNSISAESRSSLRVHMVQMIMRATRICPLKWGKVDESIDDSSTSGLYRTVVEVPYWGDAALLRGHSEVGSPLPPCFGQIDEEAHLIRFTFPGLVADQPALRVQIDEQLDVLREQIARQERALANYHDSLEENANRYIDSWNSAQRR